MLITRTRRFTTLGLALLFAICMVSSGFAHDHGFTTIDVPGASFTEAFGINPEGNIVGQYSNTTGIHGFLLSSGAFTTIDDAGAAFSKDYGVVPDNSIVGKSSIDTTSHHSILLI